MIHCDRSWMGPSPLQPTLLNVWIFIAASSWRSILCPQLRPAYINMLIVLAGRTRRTKYSLFILRLEPENVVRLGDVSPDGQSKREQAHIEIVLVEALCFFIKKKSV